MLISTNWIKDYVDTDDNELLDIANKVTNSGVNVEEVISSNINNLVVGEVLEVSDHPDSDHMHVCKVNVGSEVLQIVCGASNVRANTKVIVSLVGAILPGNIEIKETVLRGIKSCGMICALFELGLTSKEESYNDGIHILDDSATIGDNALNYLGNTDTVFRLDLNPNRNDCLSHLGFAYEVGAVCDRKVNLPDTTYSELTENIKDIMSININTDKCMMYQTKMVKNVTIKESPDFIKNRLLSAGMRPINNVVDISNYVMLEYGQPLHFFDHDKLGNNILVRDSYDNETVETLDKKIRKLNEEDIVITDGKRVVCIAGVMGAINTDVDDNTKNIVIESAIFNSTNVRRTSIKLDLRSESSLRFEKGLNYEYTAMAIDRACHLLEKYADATIVGGKLIHDNIDKTPKVASVTKDKINAVLGMQLTHEDIMNSLNRLSFDVKVEEDNYIVTIPNRRMDVSIREDIIEEVGRLYGYENIVGTLPIGPTKKGDYAPFTKFRKITSAYLRSLGLNEIKTYTLISSTDDKLFNNNKSLVLDRPLSMDKNIIRQSILPSMLKVVDYNILRHHNDIYLYEIANTYNEKYEEITKLAISIYGSYVRNNFQGKKIEADFYLLKGMIERLLNYLGYENRYSFTENNKYDDLHPGISATILVDKEEIGFLGKIHPSINKNEIYVSEINLTKLFTRRTGNIKYTNINKYPSISKDVAFILDNNISSIEVINTIKKAGGIYLTNIDIFDVYTGDKVNNGYKSIAFNLTFEDYNKTLTDEEVTIIFNKIIETVKDKYKAILRDK